MIKELVIIRGLPGSGKTTYAKTHFPHFKLVELDDYFTDEAGVFKFRIKDLPEAKVWCLRETWKMIMSGINTVVIQHFVTLDDLVPYLDFQYKYRDINVSVITCKSQFKTSKLINESTIQWMTKHWEGYTGETIINECD